MKHILIVEDDPDIQELLRAYLQDADYRTTLASDGVSAHGVLFLAICTGKKR